MHCIESVPTAYSEVKPPVRVTVCEEIEVARVPVKPLYAEHAVEPSVTVIEAGKIMITLALDGTF